MTHARPVADEIVGEMYRVRLYRPADGPPAVVAEPLVEERSMAASAAMVWDRHLHGRATELHWFEVLATRRPGDERPPLVVHTLLSVDDAGALRPARYKRVGWAEVEKASGGRLTLDAQPHRLPARPASAQRPADTTTAQAHADTARPEAAALHAGDSGKAPRRTGDLRSALRALAPGLPLGTPPTHADESSYWSAPHAHESAAPTS